MSRIREWIVIVSVATVIGVSVTYLTESHNAPITEALKVDDLAVSQQKTPATAEHADTQSYVNTVQTTIAAVNKSPEHFDQVSTEQNVISEWQFSLGQSIAQSGIYSFYDKKSLLRLASQGDIYAFQVMSIKLREAGRKETANRMLFEASARGSTESLIMMGNRLQSVRQSEEVINETYKEADIRRDYRLLQGITVKNALVRGAAAHYIVAGIRGDRDRAEANLKNLQDMDGGPFNGNKWRKIISDAEKLYKNLSKRREQLGLAEFDNRYPVEYAKLNGYSPENSFFEELKKKYENKL